MAGKDIVTRTATRLYKEKHLLKMPGLRSLYDLLFRTPDVDISADFRLDRLISSPTGFSYREKSNGSVIRRFKAGTTELIKVPRASEKTPIDEELREAVAAGSEPTDSQMSNLMKNVDNILEDHVEGSEMTKLKQSIDTVRTGVFEARGVKGQDLNLDYDHERDASNDLTYDFTLGGASMTEALLNISNKMDADGVPLQDRFVFMGDLWRTRWGSDSDILEYMKANAANQLIEQRLFAERFGGIQGVYVIAHFKPLGANADLWLLSFQPGVPYVAYEGASEEPWWPTNECFFGSFTDKTFKVQRGLDYFDDGGRVQRAAGELIVDSFYDKDPINQFVRSQMRHMYVYGNINHTGKSTGTFS